MTNLLGPLLAVTVVVPAQAPQDRHMQAVRALLAREVDFPGIDDPKATLKDALMTLRYRYGLSFRVNAAAFRNGNVENVLQELVADTSPILARKGVLVDQILRDVLSRVRVTPSNPVDAADRVGAVYIVRSYGIEVTTADALSSERFLAQPAPFTPEQRRRMQEIRNTLARESEFPGIDDPKTTLQEALVMIGRRYGLRFEVNDAAFVHENIKDVRLTPIADPNPLSGYPEQTVHALLRCAFGKIPVPSGAVFVIWPNGIEVTTNDYFRGQNLVPEPPPPPTPVQFQRALAMRDTLIRPCQFSGFDDPKMTLREALDLMAERYDLRFEIDERGFKYKNVMDVEKTPIADANPIPRAKDMILPRRVLEMLLARIPLDPSLEDVGLPFRDGPVFVIRPHGHIEITTRFFLYAQAHDTNPVGRAAGVDRWHDMHPCTGPSGPRRVLP